MNILENYNNQNLQYTPNNMYQPLPYGKYKKPYEEYNEKNELVGYYWYYGDIINLQFNITGEITVDNDDIIYTVTGEAPAIDTIGEINQKAFNIIDLISWTCTAINDNKYTWTQDEQFTYNPASNKPVYFTAADFLSGKNIKIDIYNFRYENIFTANMPASNNVTLTIGEELSKQMVKGIYYLTMTAYSDDLQVYIPILRDKDCILTVK